MIKQIQLIWQDGNLVDPRIKVNGQVKSIFTDWTSKECLIVIVIHLYKNNLCFINLNYSVLILYSIGRVNIGINSFGYLLGLRDAFKSTSLNTWCCSIFFKRFNEISKFWGHLWCEAVCFFPCLILYWHR